MKMNWAALWGLDSSWYGSGKGLHGVGWRDLSRAEKRAYIRHLKSRR